MAYDAIPDTLVYRFQLEFSSMPDSHLSDDEWENTERPKAFLTPLEEVKDLTRELRNLRRVNRESRYEGESLFDGYLRLNQTEQGDATDFCLPINLPWKRKHNFFCFVDLFESDLECLDRADTVLIDQVFSTVRLLGLSVNRAIEDGILAFGDYSGFAEFISLFHEVVAVALVSDRLMSENELEDIDDDFRSTFALGCWNDWFGRVQEDIIGCDVVNPKIVTAEEHLGALEQFADAIIFYGDSRLETTRLWEIQYGMIFRTKEDFGYLLLCDEILKEALGEDMLSDGSGDEMPGLELSELDADA